MEEIIEESGIKYVVRTSDDGTIFWHKERKYHREDGPAIEFADGSKIWYKNGNIHREDGPAVEIIDGIKEYYINNNRLNNITTDEDLIIKLLLE